MISYISQITAGQSDRSQPLCPHRAARLVGQMYELHCDVPDADMDHVVVDVRGMIVAVSAVIGSSQARRLGVQGERFRRLFLLPQAADPASVRHEMIDGAMRIHLRGVA